MRRSYCACSKALINMLLLGRSLCALQRVILALAWLSALGVPSIPAQIIRSITDGTTPPGIAAGAPAGSYALSDFDNVNLYNGNLNFRLALLKIAGRGEAGYTMTLPIEYRWSISSEHTWDGTAIYWPIPAGWSGFGVGYGPGVMEGRNGIEQEFCTDGSVIVTRTLLRLTFTSADGTEYELRDKQTDGEPDPITEYNCLGGIPSLGFDRGREFVTRDGTTMTFLADASLRDDLSGDSMLPTGNLMFRNGTRYRIVNGLVESIRDRNGNLLTFSYDQYKRVTRSTDSLGRTTDITYPPDGGALNYPDVIGFKGFGSAAREIRVWRKYLVDVLRSDYTPPEVPKTLSGLFPELLTPDNTLHNPLLVSAVQLPDGRQYEFLYNNYGELAQVTLPTGGVIEYDFGSSTTSPSGSWGSKMVYRRVKERRVKANGTSLERTTYFDAPVAGGTDPHVVTVRHYDAAGSPLARDRHSFYGRPTDGADFDLYPVRYTSWMEAREHQTEYLDLNGVTTLRRENHTWVERDPASTNPTDPRIIETITTLDPGQTYSKTSKQTFVYSLDVFNNKTDTYDYDFGETTWTRRTHVDYVTSAAYTDVGVHLRSLPLQESVFDASAGEQTRTSYEYDYYLLDDNHAPLAPRSNISQLDSSVGTIRGNATSVMRWLLPSGGTPSSYQYYDVAGNLVKIKDPQSNFTTFEYDDRFGSPDAEAQSDTAPGGLAGQKSFAFPTKVTNALQHTSYVQYDYHLGKPVNTQDANGGVDAVFYADFLDRPSQVIRARHLCNSPTFPYPCSQTSFAYEDGNRTIRTTSDLISYLDNQLKTELVYDGLGRTVETRQYESAGYIATQTQHDGMGRVWQVSNPFRSGETVFWTKFEYDALGRVTRKTTPDLAMVDTVYQGNETVSVDEAAKQSKMTHDALGRLVNVIEDPMALALQTNYEYDALNNLKLVCQGGAIVSGVCQGVQPRSFVYDALSRLTSATNPENGTVNYPSYDGNGNLLQKTDARGTITYTYDQLNHVMSRSYTDGTATVNFEYDAPPVLNSKGRLTKVTSTVSEYGYDEYDELGRVKRTSQVTGGKQYLMNYGYNRAGNMVLQMYPSGRTATTSYDMAGRVSGVTGAQTGEANRTYAFSLSYGSHGAVNAMQLGNGLWERTTFNVRLQPTQIGLGTTSASTSSLGLDYTYKSPTFNDNNGNVRSQTITAPSFSKTQDYTYDGLNRLQKADEVGSWLQDYGYDQYGNRWVTAGSYIPDPILTPQSQTAFDPATNRLIASLYDEAGNQKQDAAGRTFTYDLENRQTTFNGGAVTYSYDGEGRRVKKFEAGKTTIFVYNALGQLVAEYSDLPLSGGGTSYLTADHLGSTRLVTDAGGAIQKRYDFLPFGEEIPDTKGDRYLVDGYSGTDITRQKFTGKERDAESGLDYFGARYDSGAQGRFTSPDPVAGSAFNPQTLNMYAYAWNNPLRHTDPTGMVVSWEDSKTKCKKGESECLTNLQRKYENRIGSLLNSKNAKDRARGETLQSTYQKLQDAKEVFHVVREGGDGSGELSYRGEPGHLYVEMKGSGSMYGEMPDIQKLAHEFKHGEQFLGGLLGFTNITGKWAGYRDDLVDEANAFIAGFMAEPVGGDQSKFLKGLGQAANWGVQEVVRRLDAPGSRYRGRSTQQMTITNITPSIYAVPRSK